MKNILLPLSLAAACLSQAAVAQERAASGALETQMTWSALTTQIAALGTKVDAANGRMDQLTACSRRGLLYAPGTDTAANGGCMSSTPPTPQIRQAMNQQVLPKTGGVLDVTCNSNETLVGGGGFCNTTGTVNCRMAANTPLGNGWRVAGWADSGSPQWTVYAICMKNNN